MNEKVRKIVVAGVMGAISIFLGATHLGFIPWFAGAALTIMHVPVIIAAVLEGPVVGAVVGLIFGAFSLIQGAIAPTGPADVWFVNPLVSIVPRLCIGPVAWLAFRGSKNLKEGQIFIISGFVGVVVNTLIWLLSQKYGGFDSDIIMVFTVGVSCVAAASVSCLLLFRQYKKNSQLFPYAVSAIAGSVTNTALVLTSLGIYKFIPWQLIGTIALLNGLPEAVIAAILTAVVVATWSGIETSRKRSSV
ncbi:MAG TPA: ECF transporter S component [Spirochaetota bacterium]|nr:ECF transporter S component [Spirochaetota bacterium]